MLTLTADCFYNQKLNGNSVTLTVENMHVAKTRSVSHWKVKSLVAVATIIVLITLVRHIQSGVGSRLHLLREVRSVWLCSSTSKVIILVCKWTFEVRNFLVVIYFSLYYSESPVQMSGELSYSILCSVTVHHIHLVILVIQLHLYMLYNLNVSNNSTLICLFSV